MNDEERMMELGRLLGEPVDSADYWEGWRKAAGMLRRDAEIMEWCAGSVRDRLRRGQGPACEDAVRLASALGRICRLLGSTHMKIEAQEVLSVFLQEDDECDDEYDDEEDL